MKRRFKFTLKRMFILLVLIPMVLGLVIWGSHIWVEKSSHPFCYDEVNDVPDMDVALVLGCSPKVAGRVNPFYQYRIDAAAELHRAGKVKAFIVSGDNGTHRYDETTAMKESLLGVGVPEKDIYCDYAGFRTLDSVVRAQVIFGQSKFIVVSQRFHNERAVFIARRHGIEAVGYNARDVSKTIAPTTYLREYLARVNAVMDVTVLQTKPKFYGPPVTITK